MLFFQDSNWELEWISIQFLPFLCPIHWPDPTFYLYVHPYHQQTWKKYVEDTNYRSYSECNCFEYNIKEIWLKDQKLQRIFMLPTYFILKQTYVICTSKSHFFNRICLRHYRKGSNVKMSQIGICFIIVSLDIKLEYIRSFIQFYPFNHEILRYKVLRRQNGLAPSNQIFKRKVGIIGLESSCFSYYWSKVIQILSVRILVRFWPVLLP